MEALHHQPSTRRGRRADRRAGAREATDLPAVATFDGRVVCCTVLDLSAEGARLSPTLLGDLPDAFDLRLPGREAKVRARVVWCDGGAVGVELLD